jgi:hypothetical protein
MKAKDSTNSSDEIAVFQAYIDLINWERESPDQRVCRPRAEGHHRPGQGRALQDAASVAGLLVTTEAGVAETPKKKEEHMHMPGGGMGGMDIM